MSASKLGQFGEPWRHEKQPGTTDHCILTAGAENEAVEVAYDAGPKDAARIVACVNALDGKDPEALVGLIEAAEEIAQAYEGAGHCHFCGRKPGHDADCSLILLRAALAAFGVKS